MYKNTLKTITWEFGSIFASSIGISQLFRWAERKTTVGFSIRANELHEMALVISRFYELCLAAYDALSQASIYWKNVMQIQAFRSNGLKILGLCAAYSFLAFAGQGQTAFAQNIGVGVHDPLTPNEMQAVRGAGWAQSDSRMTNPSKRPSVIQKMAAAVTGDPADEPLFLMMERSDNKQIANAGRRLANAFYYDYANDELIQVTIDLINNVVVDRYVHIDTQLPLTQGEIDRAFELVLAEPRMRADLGHVYRNVTGRDFSDVDQLNYKAFIFRAETMQSGLQAGGANCGIERCAHLLVYAQDNTSLEFSPLVNLSTGEVVQNLEQAGSVISRRQPSYSDPLPQRRRGVDGRTAHRH